MQEAEEVTRNYVDNVRDEYKARSRVRTGDNRRHTYSETKRVGLRIYASAYNNSDHNSFLELGHMVRKGQLFFDTETGEFKRVTRTRWIPGDHQFEASINAHYDDFATGIHKAVGK